MTKKETKPDKWTAEEDPPFTEVPRFHNPQEPRVRHLLLQRPQKLVTRHPTITTEALDTESEQSHRECCLLEAVVPRLRGSPFFFEQKEEGRDRSLCFLACPPVCPSKLFFLGPEDLGEPIATRSKASCCLSFSLTDKRAAASGPKDSKESRGGGPKSGAVPLRKRRRGQRLF